MTFGEALEHVKCGYSMRLPTWDRDVLVKAQFPETNSIMTVPFLYTETRFTKTPYSVSTVELFCEEWEVVK